MKKPKEVLNSLVNLRNGGTKNKLLQLAFGTVSVNLMKIRCPINTVFVLFFIMDKCATLFCFITHKITK